MALSTPVGGTLALGERSRVGVDNGSPPIPNSIIPVPNEGTLHPRIPVEVNENDPSHYIHAIIAGVPHRSMADVTRHIGQEVSSSNMVTIPAETLALFFSSTIRASMAALALPAEALAAPPNQAILLKKRMDLNSVTVTIEFNTSEDDTSNTCVRLCFDELILETLNKQDLSYDIQTECHKHVENLKCKSKFNFPHFCCMSIFRIFLKRHYIYFAYSQPLCVCT